MAIRKIAQLGEPVLRRVARPLAPPELALPSTRALIDDLIDTMRDADGAGLAAPQVYESVQLVVIEGRDNPRYPGADRIPLTILANPKVTPLVGKPGEALGDADAISLFEGCLSVSGVRGRVRRPRRVRVEALDASGKPVEFVWEGFRAAVIQHETDHLFGTLFVDRADSRTLTFLREYERHVPVAERLVDGGGSPGLEEKGGRA
jgi:peptide deformylase